MPSHSVKQAKVMSAIAHGWKPEGLDIPVKVAKEFHEADAGHKYGARAMGGVAPMLAQASMPMMPGGLGMGTNGVAGGMPQPGVAMPGGTVNQSPTATRPLKRGGTASGISKPVKMTTGPLVSTVPGRTDLHFTHVPSGSYVIPADIVSGHGQGNTLAGMEHLHKFFKMGDGAAGSSPGAAQRHFSKGGTADKHVGKPVPVKLAGGEIVVPPHNLHETMQRVAGRKLTLEEAHQVMDKWVVNKRKKLRRTLAKLPGPVKD
jgi:hypothetical protein